MAGFRAALLVDPDEIALETLAAVVRSHGYRVYPRRSFSEACHVLLSVAPCLIITDARLGRHSGLQLVRLAADLFPRTTCIVLTASDDVDLRRRAAPTGATFLLKPLRMLELGTVLEATSRADERPARAAARRPLPMRMR